MRLIDDILDLSRIEAGAVSMSVEPVSVAEVVSEIVRNLGPMTARQGLKLTLVPLPADVPLVSVDRTRFAQILMNFRSNAIKYNRPSGSVTFEVSLPSASIVRVNVHDTGSGIPVDKQKSLFQPFQRAGQETGPIEGTGIGLVITKRLAQLMGAGVGFRSEPGRGSTFWVDMPVREQALDAGTVAPPREPDARAFAAATRRRVLYVEDNPANIAFMRDLVGTFENIDLLTAPTAEMGIALAHERPPDLVLMDINLPGMSGFEALRELRSTEATNRIPVIALTAAASERDRERGVRQGFFRYLTKSVKVDEVVSALEGLFGSA